MLTLLDVLLDFLAQFAAFIADGFLNATCHWWSYRRLPRVFSLKLNAALVSLVGFSISMFLLVPGKILILQEILRHSQYAGIICC
jgi:hypothetical protein